jgi:probable rRNA maturation factor
MVEINNLTSEKINESFLRKISHFVLKREGKKSNSLSIALVKPEEIRKLNKKYRKKDAITDVLSFSKKNDIIKKEKEKLRGEIVLCPEQIRKNAQSFNQNFQKELSWALIHGILHIFGYDHKKEEEAQKMKEKENYYLDFLINNKCQKKNL